MELIYDIEADGLDITGKIHSIGVRLLDRTTDKEYPIKAFTRHWLPNSDGNLKTFLKGVRSLDNLTMIGHNSINFDKPFIEKYFNTTLSCRHLDTMILAKLCFTEDQLIAIDRGIPEITPKNWGSFSLDAFGKRLGIYKAGYDGGWETLTKEMVDYMEQDVVVTTALYKKLIQMPSYPSEKVIKLEHDVATIIAEQERAGFYFDIEKARKFYTSMLFEKGNIERTLTKTFKPMFLPDGPVQQTNKLIKRKLYRLNPYYTPLSYIKPYVFQLKRFKSGKIRLPKKTAFKWFNTPHSTIIQEKLGEYQNIKLTKFTATDNQIKIWLKHMYNFEFSTYTAKGNVKVDRNDLETLGEYGINLRRLIKLKKDISQLGGTDNSLIKRFNEKTHSIHGRVDTLGAATHRMTHSSPNLAQIPSTEDFRSLFVVPSGWKLVGADLANIEVRILAHYLVEHGNTDYLKAVLSKDMHWYHAKLAGFWTVDDRPWPSDADEHLRTPEMKIARTLSKSFFFGFLYGQGDTIRGFTLWNDIIADNLQYTETEYIKAKTRIERRLNKEGLFPLKKDLFVKPTETLILQTIYGKQVAEKFLKNLTGITELIKDCQNQSKTKGTVTAIDGRELFSRSPHSALNLLLQGSAGIVGKKWMVNYTELAKKENIQKNTQYKQYAYIHDEFQCGCIENKSKLLAYCLEEGAKRVTKQFNLNIPIEANATIGDNWAQTH